MSSRKLARLAGLVLTIIAAFGGVSTLSAGDTTESTSSQFSTQVIEWF